MGESWGLGGELEAGGVSWGWRLGVGFCGTFKRKRKLFESLGRATVPFVSLGAQHRTKQQVKHMLDNIWLHALIPL